MVDLRPALTRAQAERAVYEKYQAGQPLSADEARALLPERAEFVALWRYLKRQCAGQCALEDTAARIARGMARASGRREAVVRTQLCLDVFAERGLITLEAGEDALAVHILPGRRANLEESAYVRRLRWILSQEEKGAD